MSAVGVFIAHERMLAHCLGHKQDGSQREEQQVVLPAAAAGPVMTMPLEHVQADGAQH